MGSPSSGGGLGSGPSNLKPDLGTEGIKNDLTSGVKGQASSTADLKPDGGRLPSAEELAGGSAPDAEPNLDADSIKKPKK